MWEKIKNVFERDTVLIRHTARRCFYTVCIGNGEKVSSCFNRIKPLAATLKAMYVEIDDKEIATAVLDRLPLSYETMFVSLDALGSDDSSMLYHLVKSRLLPEEQRVDLSGKSGDSSA